MSVLRVTFRVADWGAPSHGEPILPSDELMKRWDEVMFARLLARAIPTSILSEKDADEAARQAITRTRATISADDLKAE